MTTVVVYKTDTKEVLAAIPMDGGDAVCRNDVEFQIYNGTEPIFTETPGGIFSGSTCDGTRIVRYRGAERRGDPPGYDVYR